MLVDSRKYFAKSPDIVLISLSHADVFHIDKFNKPKIDL